MADTPGQLVQTESELNMWMVQESGILQSPAHLQAAFTSASAPGTSSGDSQAPAVLHEHAQCADASTLTCGRRGRGAHGLMRNDRALSPRRKTHSAGARAPSDLLRCHLTVGVGEPEASLKQKLSFGIWMGPYYTKKNKYCTG